MKNMNEKALENFLDTIREVYSTGLYSLNSPEWIISSGIDEKAFKFKLKHKLTATFVAYKKENDYYLHSYNIKGFPLTKDEFKDYLTMLICIGDFEIVKTTENGKKPK
jgi:hypothetical protein